MLAAREAPADESSVLAEGAAAEDITSEAPTANQVAADELALDGEPAAASPVTPKTEEN